MKNQNNTKQNKIRIKFNSINPIHQTNANLIITVTTNDVQSVKVQSNELEIVQSNQSINCLRLQIRLENHPNNL